MGKTESKEIEHNGDTQVTLINNQEAHTAYHEAHGLKLWVILIVTLTHLLITIAKIYEKRLKRKHQKQALSVIDLGKA